MGIPGESPGIRNLKESHLPRLGQNRTPSLPELLRAAVEDELSDFFVAMPGKVEKYTDTGDVPKANVKPLLKRAFINQDGSEGLDDLGIVNDVPVIWPRGGGFFFRMPVQVGDNVLLVFMDRSIDEYMFSGGSSSVDPVDFREHDISDAVAIPGFYPFAKPLKNASAVAGKLALGADVPGKFISVDSTGITEINGNFKVLP